MLITGIPSINASSQNMRPNLDTDKNVCYSLKVAVHEIMVACQPWV